MRDYSRYPSLRIEQHDTVALLTLNRPERLNAIDTTLYDELRAVLDDLVGDDAFNAIVITGAGKAFSAGGDIKAIKAELDDRSKPRVAYSSHDLVNTILSVEKPLIAAVNGHALGIGATVALLCDIVIISEHARLGDPHVKLGLVAGLGGCVMWPLLVGVSRAKQYLMAGDQIEAKEAERIGLVNKVVAQDQVLPEAMACARRLADGAPKAIRWTKPAVNEYVKSAMALMLPTTGGVSVAANGRSRGSGERICGEPTAALHRAIAASEGLPIGIAVSVTEEVAARKNLAKGGECGREGFGGNPSRGLVGIYCRPAGEHVVGGARRRRCPHRAGGRRRLD